MKSKTLTEFAKWLDTLPGGTSEFIGKTGCTLWSVQKWRTTSRKPQKLARDTIAAHYPECPLLK